MKLVCVRSRAVVELPDGALPPYGVFSHTRDRPFLREHVAVGSDFVGSDFVGSDYDVPPPHYSPSPTSPPLPYSYISKNSSATNTKYHGSTFDNTNKRPYTLNTKSTWALCGDTLEHLCRHALRSGIEYVWIDEFCIDKTSTADLDDAVNGARRRLRNSALCFAHLHDLPAATVTTTTTTTTMTTISEADASAWSRCRYWKRAWTLQELILPPRVRFYDAQWNYRGDKDSPVLAPLLSRITGIPRSVLVDAAALADVALAVRISWSAGRAAAREEDTAYALVAVTGATLPVRYGEGAARAFFRLQEELLRDTRDGSLLAWRSARGDDGEVRGLLARSPAEFGHFAATATATVAAQEPQRPWIFNGKVRFSSKGIELESRVCKGPGCVLLSIGQKRQDLGTSKSIAICFREWNGIYVRVASALRVSLSALRSWRCIDVMRDVDDSHSRSLRSLFVGMPCRIEMTKRGGLEGAWRPPSLPRVVQDSEEVAVQHQDHQDHHHPHQQADVKMDEGDEVMLPLSPQKSQTPSNHSEGSYVYIAMAGSWMPSQEPPPSSSSFPHAKDHDTYSDAGADEDVISSADSDPGSLTSNSASVTESESGDDSNNGPSHHPYPVMMKASAEANDDFDADAPATETRSTTTLAADKDDRDSLRGLVMQPAIRDHVLATSYQRVMAWIQTVTYVEPPQDRIPPRSRINPTDWFASAESLTLLCGNGNGDGPREHMVKVSRPDGYFHLACPFFAADPAAHRSCVLAGRDLQTLAGVLAHIRAHHPPTAYCAFCHCDFAADYDARDAHMALRTCKPVGHFAPQGDASRKGVPEAQLRRIEDKDRLRAARGKGEAERWRRIYRALFPDLVQRTASDGCDPYLRGGNGYAVSLVHDYWTLHKRECVAEALEACGGHDIDELNDGEALDAIYQSTLTALVTKIYHEWHLKKEEA
ncbi:Vegetative incompatibility protein HET-E-1 [Beauveria bassiana]|uniref:Vegetative incompatibility protein HET-E-1 n=1 Tax=Beauveria bassiana TaxID=176275 RepID=A0A2N6N965_BEABA|nr:Vegetative incompatibility protein HET-E-1 [Beauveria bassiana]